MGGVGVCDGRYRKSDGGISVAGGIISAFDSF